MHAEIQEVGTRRLLLRAPTDDPRVRQFARQGAMVWWVQDPEDRAERGGLNWRYRESRDGEIALFEACGLRAVVVDQDGDSSVWTVQRRGRDGRFSIIYEGTEESCDPLYHMDAAMAAAECALRAEVARRKQIITASK